MQNIPLYDLERVRQAASEGNVFLSRKAQRDYQNLGYELDDVHAGLAGLTLGDYRGRALYEDIEYDVYRLYYAANAGPVDEIYVKLSSNERSTVPQILVVSFHI